MYSLHSPSHCLNSYKSLHQSYRCPQHRRRQQDGPRLRLRQLEAVRSTSRSPPRRPSLRGVVPGPVSLRTLGRRQRLHWARGEALDGVRRTAGSARSAGGEPRRQPSESKVLKALSPSMLLLDGGDCNGTGDGVECVLPNRTALLLDIVCASRLILTGRDCRPLLHVAILTD